MSFAQTFMDSIKKVIRSLFSHSVGRFIPRFKFSRVYKQILPPMVAMLVLTSLVAMLVYQLTDTWQHEVRKLNLEMGESIYISNVRLSLLRLDKLKNQSPDKAMLGWNALKQELRYRSTEEKSSSQIKQLYAFMMNDKNLAHVDDLFLKPELRQPVPDIQEKLNALQQYTSYVTQGVTISLVSLGMILTVVTILDLGRLFSNLEDSRDLNIQLQEEERHRIALELHDGVIQELVDLKRAYSPEKVDTLVANIRRICHNLKPQILVDIGFSAALESLAQEIRSQTGALVTLSYEEEELSKLPKSMELALFRVIQEVANNIKKHANATKVRISLVYDPSAHRDLRIQVVDDGVGFDWATVKKGMGLLGIRERVDRLGGHFVLETAPQEGCSYQFYIPLKAYF